MFSLRPCYHWLAHSSLFHPVISLRRSSLFFPDFTPKPLLLKLLFSSNPNSKRMSSRPSAFDALMSNARAAAKKKPQTSSPKKRKTQESNEPSSQNPSNTQNPISKPIDETSSGGPNQAQQSDNNPQNISSKWLEKTHDSNGPKQKNPDSMSSVDASVVKKPRLITPDESLVQLKKKPANFDPKSAAFWGDGERVPFLFIVKAFDAISKETGRIAITDIVCNMLRTVIQTTPDDLLAVVYLLANRIAPAHEGLELGIGDASIIKALAEACGGKEAKIKADYTKLGDLGLVAKARRSSQSLMRKPEALTVAKVVDTFRLIAKESGKDSQEKKKNHIRALLVAATDCEPQYLIRLLQTKLRIGLAEQTLLVALGYAAVYAEKHSSPPGHTDSLLDELQESCSEMGRN